MKKFFVLCSFLAAAMLSAPVVQAVEKPAAVATAPININTAGASELERLPGVGKVTAEAIIQYRNAHGNFASSEDLLNVKGIGKKTLEKFQGQVVVK